MEYRGQASAYARGKVAINISQGSEEEGVSHKPFQIAASGVPLVHIDRKGLAECFDPTTEVAVFDTPAEAREIIGELVRDPDRRSAMASAARQRFERDHTWAQRLTSMFELASLPIREFQAKSAAISN